MIFQQEVIEPEERTANGSCQDRQEESNVTATTKQGSKKSFSKRVIVGVKV